MFEIIITIKNNNNMKYDMVLSHVSLALFMRPRLVSVVGEFLWSGKWPVDDDVQCFPGGH